MLLTENKKHLMLIAILVICVFLLSPQLTFADTDWDDAAEAATESNIIMDMTSQFTIDMEDKTVPIVGTIIYTFGGIIFALGVSVASIAVFLLELATEMAFLEDIAKNLEELLVQPLSDTFVVESNNDILMFAIAVTMIGIVFALLKTRTSEAVSKFLKIVGIIALVMVLMHNHNSATLFVEINTAASSVTKSVSALPGNDDEDSIETPVASLWEICVVKPWAMLNFNDTYEKWDEPVEIGEELQAKFGDSVNISDLKPAIGFLAQGKYNQDFMKAYLLMDHDDREAAMQTAIENGQTNFKNTRGGQAARFGLVLLFFIMTLMLSGISIILSLAIIAVKLLAMMLFFLWPLVALYALFSSEGFQILKRWFVVVILMFVGCIVVQFIQAMLIVMVEIVVGTASTYPGMLASLLVIVGVVLAIRFGFRPFMMILAPSGFRKVNSEFRAMAMFRMMQQNHGGGRGWFGRKSKKSDEDDKDGDSDDSPPGSFFASIFSRLTNRHNGEEFGGNEENAAENVQDDDVNGDMSQTNQEDTYSADELGQVHNADNEADIESQEEAQKMDVGDSDIIDKDGTSHSDVDGEPSEIKPPSENETGESNGSTEDAENKEVSEREPERFDRSEQEKAAQEAIEDTKEKDRDKAGAVIENERSQSGEGQQNIGEMKSDVMEGAEAISVAGKNAVSESVEKDSKDTKGATDKTAATSKNMPPRATTPVPPTGGVKKDTPPSEDTSERKANLYANAASEGQQAKTPERPRTQPRESQSEQRAGMHPRTSQSEQGPRPQSRPNAQNPSSQSRERKSGRRFTQTERRANGQKNISTDRTTQQKPKQENGAKKPATSKEPQPKSSTQHKRTKQKKPLRTRK